MRKVTAGLLAAIIAYPMDQAGFTPSERERMARILAEQLGIKQVDRFLELCKQESEKEEPRLSAEEIIDDWRKGRISAHLRDVMLRAEGYELKKDQVTQ